MEAGGIRWEGKGQGEKVLGEIAGIGGIGEVVWTPSALETSCNL